MFNDPVLEVSPALVTILRLAVEDVGARTRATQLCLVLGHKVTPVHDLVGEEEI
jgi:hypothetical protein